MATTRARFPGWDNLYLFGDPVESRALRLRSVGLTREESLAIVKGIAPDQPVVAERDQGTQLRDVLWSSSLVPMAIRHRVVDLFSSEGLTGWSTYELELVRHDGEDPPTDYVGLLITATCGPLIKGDRHRFDPTTWDGSDFFRPHNVMGTFVTQRVERALRAANVRNVRLVPLADTEPPGWNL